MLETEDVLLERKDIVSGHELSLEKTGKDEMTH